MGTKNTGKDFSAVFELVQVRVNTYSMLQYSIRTFITIVQRMHPNHNSDLPSHKMPKQMSCSLDIAVLLRSVRKRRTT